MKLSSISIASAIVVGLAAAAWQLLPTMQITGVVSGDDPLVLPTLSGITVRGQMLFDANCASCHGPYGTGTDKGPPLVHKIYEPSHHADFAFHRAVQHGVRAHHWRFGNMPAVPVVSEAEVTSIIAFVRAMQTANGIN